MFTTHPVFLHHSSFKKLSPIDWFPSNPEKEQSLFVAVFSRSSSRNSHEPPRGISLLENLPPLSKNQVKRSKKRKLCIENNLLRIKGTNSSEIYYLLSHPCGFSIATSTYLAVVKRREIIASPGRVTLGLSATWCRRGVVHWKLSTSRSQTRNSTSSKVPRLLLQGGKIGGKDQRFEPSHDPWGPSTSTGSSSRNRAWERSLPTVKFNHLGIRALGDGKKQNGGPWMEAKWRI